MSGASSFLSHPQHFEMFGQATSNCGTQTSLFKDEHLGRKYFDRFCLFATAKSDFEHYSPQRKCKETTFALPWRRGVWNWEEAGGQAFLSLSLLATPKPRPLSLFSQIPRSPGAMAPWSHPSTRPCLGEGYPFSTSGTIRAFKKAPDCP